MTAACAGSAPEPAVESAAAGGSPDSADYKASRATLRLLRSIRRDRRRGRERSVDGVTAVLAVLLPLGYLGQLIAGVMMVWAPEPDPVRGWAVAGLATAIAAGLLALLRAFGPIAAGRATASLLLTAPISRRLVLPRAMLVIVALGVPVGALLAVAGAAFAGGGVLVDYLWAAAAGGLLGAVLVAIAVLAQEFPRFRMVLPVLVVVAGALVAAALLARVFGWALPVVTGWSLVVVVIAGLALLAGAAGWAAWRGLDRLPRKELSVAGELVTAAQASGAFLDPSMLSGVMIDRRTQRIGSVRWRPLPPSRVGALLAVDVRRYRRFPGACLLAAGALALPYGVLMLIGAVGVPTAATVGCVLAASSAAVGLRAVTRSAALQRMLGGSTWSVRWPHLLLPAVVALLWTALCIPAAGPALLPVLALTPPAAMLFVLLQAKRPEPDYTSPIYESGFGMVQPQVVWALGRGGLLVVLVGIGQAVIASAVLG
ncbi:DUF6297 family protein [Nakamurella aerolata]|uniref:ABC-2 type transport system permease protein n=1 Tax=Nakamurella aerolata TaxID=1656892 RepID=A0A849AAB4_9ACTN|nr:DUF6297 family protein [Nakamurella aerolata]NNG37459.1 hypothetical protein [Nakamurella aerolata]